MTPTSRVGIKDVARLAGVAQGTVSNVLNHPDRVSKHRREAVERAIAELGFVRHEAARQLRAGDSSTIGLLLLDAWNPSFIDMARGVEDATAAHDLTLLMSNSGRDLDREKLYLRLFAERRVAGLIVVPHDESNDSLHRIRAGGVPVVVLDRAEQDQRRMSVTVDDFEGGELVARHLIELGHRHIAFVGTAETAKPVHNRLSGVRKAIADSGLDIRLDLLPADLSADAGREVGDRLGAMPPGKRPTAVAAAIDLIAVGLLQAFVQRGLHVPGDISLVGYDDIPFARQLSIPLTTIRRPHYDMGVLAAELLAETLADQLPQPSQRVFRPSLVVRDSAGPAPTRPSPARPSPGSAR